MAEQKRGPGRPRKSESEKKKTTKKTSTTKKTTTTKKTKAQKERDFKKQALALIKVSKKTKAIARFKDFAITGKHMKTKMLILTSVLVFLLLSTVPALFIVFNNKIISGIEIEGISVEDLTYEEAESKIAKHIKDKLSEEITLKHGDYERKITANELGYDFHIKEAATDAFNVGRNSGYFSDNWKIIGARLFKKNIPLEYTYDENAFSSLVTNAEELFTDKKIEPSYTIDGNILHIDEGQDGYIIDKNALTDEISSFILSAEATVGPKIIEIPVRFMHKQQVDVADIYYKVKRDPKDAYFTTDPYAVYPEENGIDFSIPLEEALNLRDIPITYIPPSYTVKDFGAEAFPNLLASYTTTYNEGNWGRSENIRLSSSACNGTIVLPGEEFSFNQVVGQRTPGRGYQVAAVYVGDRVTTDYGGGICQVSSTIYNAALRANLEIVERTNHTFVPDYVPNGLDATVSWGGPEFIFRNSRSYPIRVECDGYGGAITCNIYGLESADEIYQVEIYAETTSWISPSTIYEDDPSLPAGTEVVSGYGESGARAVSYRVLYKDGVEVSSEFLASDSYLPHNRTVRRGTG